MTSVAGKVIKNTGWLYAKMGITMFISLLVTRLILAALGASDFGIYNIVGGSIAMLGFISGSLSGGTVRFMAYAEGQDDSTKKTVIFNVCTVMHVTIAVIMILVLIAAGFLFFQGFLNIPSERLTASYVVYGSLIVATAFTIIQVPYDAVINSHENMKFYAIVGLIESISKLLVALACVYTSKDKLIVYGILMALIPIVTYNITRIYCRRHYGECTFKPRTYWDGRLLREILSFSSWDFLNTMACTISTYGLGIALNHFFGTLLNAAFGIANQLNCQLLAFSTNMLKAVIPVITKSEGSGQRTAMLYRTTLACKYSYLILAVFAIPFILEANYILKIWLKEVPAWTVLFAQMTLIMSLLEQLCVAYGTALKAEGNIGFYSRVKSVFNLMPIIIVTLLFMQGFPPYMLYVVRLGWSGVLGTGVAVYFMHRNCGMEYSMFTRELLFPVILTTMTSVLAGMVPVLLMEESISRILMTIALSLVGGVVGYWLFAIGIEERKILKMVYSRILAYIRH